MITEDSVRDGYVDNNNFVKGAKQILEFDKPEPNVKQGTGQITTFKQLGFMCPRNNKKPDGWYLPDNFNNPAIVLETKNSNEDLDDSRWIKEIKENSEIVQTKYKKVIGILYNGKEVRVYKNGNLLKDCGNNVLQNKKFYLDIFNEVAIDKQEIYKHTKSINENLHANFGVKNLNHRMIFTACALVAERYGANLNGIKDTNFAMLHTSIHSAIGKALLDSENQNQKLDLLLEVYSEIKMNLTENINAINNFINDVCAISDSINSSKWNGEDVMAIFFNEFNRYKGKSESGQVFTPDHIVSLMYRLLECNKDDVILDAACGSGTFLVKSMANMIHEAGGPNTSKAKEIKSKQLYGVEFDREIFALACANMLIHKDGKSNLIQNDTREESVCKWIKTKPITKVLMNPPYENKYGCMKIVENVLNNVKAGTLCAFILPDKKLEKTNSHKLLNKHTLKKIIKLPEETFDEGVSTSIFIFEAGKPQIKNGIEQEIFTCEIKEDGLVRVKNQRRQDVYNKWHEIENYWVDVCYKQIGDESIKWIKPSKNTLSYPNKEMAFELYEEDFIKTVMDYEFFKQGIDVKSFNEKLTNLILYSNIFYNNDLSKAVFNSSKKFNPNNWKEFKLIELFNITGSKTTKKIDLNLEDGGEYPYVTTAGTNNGICGYSNIFTEEGNVITIDSAVLGTAFYQKENFTASDHVEKLMPKDFEMTENIGLFISTILNSTGRLYGYAYNEKRSQSALKKETLKLPIKANEIPDWEYMNDYIEQVKTNVNNRINVLKQINNHETE